MHTYVQKTKPSKPSLSATSTAFGSGHFGCSHAVDSTLPLQRIIGNQAALHLLKSSMEEDDLESTTQVGAVQARLAIGQPGDEYEREADRIAEQIVRRGQTSDLSHQNADSTTVGSVDASAQPSSTAGRPLETQNRLFFESRFHHDFADVQVFTDWKANQSALGLQARAYTIGNNISFAPDEYRPDTTEGRHLLAHELSHVIQQRRMPRVGALMIQRQPRPATQTPESPPEKKKSLKESGIGVNDPIFDKTAQIIDEVLQRNQRLAPYIGDKLKSGFRIAAKGKFVQELSNGNFDDAYREAYNLDKSDSIPSTILGFYDHKKLEVHLRPDAKFGTAIHESVHKLASSQLYAHLSIAKKVSENLVTVLTEGVTAFFTDHILIDEGLTKHIDAYHNTKKKAAELVKALGSNGFDLIARFNFKFAIVDMGNALGLSPKQYGDLKAGAPEEVFKRINNLLKNI